jgi:hypothetical protein
MNQFLMKRLIQNIFQKINLTRKQGQKEYARQSSNVFANFERIAKNLELTREEVLLVYLLKHIDGISSYVKGHKSQREDIRGRLTDAIVYLCLLWGMVNQNEYPDDNILWCTDEKYVMPKESNGKV